MTPARDDSLSLRARQKQGQGTGADIGNDNPPTRTQLPRNFIGGALHAYACARCPLLVQRQCTEQLDHLGCQPLERVTTRIASGQAAIHLGTHFCCVRHTLGSSRWPIVATTNIQLRHPKTSGTLNPADDAFNRAVQPCCRQTLSIPAILW